MCQCNYAIATVTKGFSSYDSDDFDYDDDERSAEGLSELSMIHKVSSTRSPKHGEEGRTEVVCTDFIQLLIDHLCQKRLMQLTDPVQLAPVVTSILDLDNGQLSGLRSFKRTCAIDMSHEELWRKPDNSTPNSEITIPQWMRKRDKKLADVLNLSFCIGTQSKLQLSGLMKVKSIFGNYGPEHGLVTLSNISVRVNMSAFLYTNGSMHFELDRMKIERLDDIRFEQDVNQRKDSHDDDESEEALTSSGFLSNYSSALNWLVNGPLRMTLVIVIEGLLNDTFSAMVKKAQEN